ncbi:hypothetical protein ABEB36_006987 [Hypothenemus hampei]|uniref:Uncharacterized protein n=1 Tax=Hypothenemus hampei TaxID=57062 RepID=A0ABD1ESG4_HYPHA
MHRFSLSVAWKSPVFRIIRCSSSGPPFHYERYIIDRKPKIVYWCTREQRKLFNFRNTKVETVVLSSSNLRDTNQV